MTTLGTDLSDSAASWPRARPPKAGDAAKARLAGTVWGRSELALLVYRGFLALGDGLARLGVSANALTYLSLALAALSCLAAAQGAFALAGLMVILSGLCDVLDGVVARSSGTVSRYGALLDSTIDRLTDALPLLGVLLFFGKTPLLALIPGAAMLGSFAIPYARARAESLGISLPSLFMRRPERLVLLIVCLLLGELSIKGGLAAPFLLFGLAVLTLLNTWGAIMVLRTAHKLLAGSEQQPQSGKPTDPVTSRPAAVGRM